MHSTHEATIQSRRLLSVGGGGGGPSKLTGVLVGNFQSTHFKKGTKISFHGRV